MTNYTQNCSGSLAVNHVGFTNTLLQVVRHWMHRQQLKARVQRERNGLLDMSDAMLKDIGISHAEAKQEAQRKDIPAQRF